MVNIFYFIVGLLGYIVHLYFKFQESTHFQTNWKNKKIQTWDDFNVFIKLFWNYFKNNSYRESMGILGYLTLYIIFTFDEFFMINGDPISNTLYNLIGFSKITYLNYFVMGYLSDSIIRNIWKVIVNLINSVQSVNTQLIENQISEIKVNEDKPRKKTIKKKTTAGKRKGRLKKENK